MRKPKRSAYEAALSVLTTLRDGGHTALFAGGCVRDRLLGRIPKDYDIATDATPDRVLALFPRGRSVGAQFGVILVRSFGHDIEVATFRSDGNYSDGRRPDAVTFGSAEQDALRRDFTINGLFLDPLEDRVIDYVLGQDDLKSQVIRTIGDPMLRFGEDHLRMLRAVRFASILSFAIAERTLAAIQSLAPRLTAISPERIWMELDDMLSSPTRAESWRLLVRTGLCDHLVQDWKPTAKDHELVIRRISHLPHEPRDATVALGALLLDESDATAAQIAGALRLSNRQHDALVWIVRSVPRLYNHEGLELADLKLLMADPGWLYAVELFKADLLARGAALTTYAGLVERAGRIPPDSITPPPLLTGADLIARGVQPGRPFGDIIKQVYRAQLNDVIALREEALALADELVSKIVNGRTD